MKVTMMDMEGWILGASNRVRGARLVSFCGSLGDQMGQGLQWPGTSLYVFLWKRKLQLYCIIELLLTAWTVWIIVLWPYIGCR